MASYNKVLLMGNLTRDPQLKYLPSQTAVCEFGVACNRKYKLQSGEQREEVTFVDCSAFAKTAELINQYFSKGKPIFIEGRLKYDQWEDKQGGGKRSRLSVHVDNFQFIGGRDSAGGSAPPNMDEQVPPQSNRASSRPPAAAPSTTPPQAAAPEQPFPEEPQFKEDDIPF
jgi:single-strand DNA-binding protein